MPLALRAEQITYRSPTTRQALMDEVSFALEPGEVLAVRGRSGSGRSALLEICAGLHKPDSGRVLWDGQPIAALSRGRLLESRQRLGFMFQSGALISNLTVYDNLALPLRHYGMAESPLALKVTQSLALHGLANAARALPEDLPRAALKRVALARALIAEPELLIMDDPTSGLDPMSQQEIAQAIIAFRNGRSVTMLVATNSDMLCGHLGGHVGTLEGGRLTMHR
jgi:phospholipid/cholesterol/gamma-HCH transport system ATP-binding protein